MSRSITFSSTAWEQYKFWADADKKTARKINRLIEEIDRMGNEGTGKPEPLVGDLSGYWSRRINERDRLIYSFDNDTIYILSCRYHYKDR